MCHLSPDAAGGDIKVDCGRCTCTDSDVQHDWSSKSETNWEGVVWHRYEVCSVCYSTRNDWWLDS